MLKLWWILRHWELLVTWILSFGSTSCFLLHSLCLWACNFKSISQCSRTDRRKNGLAHCLELQQLHWNSIQRVGSENSMPLHFAGRLFATSSTDNSILCFWHFVFGNSMAALRKVGNLVKYVFLSSWAPNSSPDKFGYVSQVLTHDDGSSAVIPPLENVCKCVLWPSSLQCVKM